MELGYNWTGTQWDWDTMGVGHYGTKTLAIHRDGTHRDSDTGNAWNWDTLGLRYRPRMGLAHNETGTKWAWNTMGLRYRQ